MELRVLQYFLAVAREGNVTRAARMLHVSQPAVSRQLMQLEAELGVKLFDRTSHSVTLTQEGVLLKRRAEEMMELAEKMRRDFEGVRDDVAGEVAIGSGELRAASSLARALVAFQKEHPLVRYRLYSANADSIKQKIEHGTLDMGLLPMPAQIDRYEFLRFPCLEEWGVLIRKDSPLACKSAVTADDLMTVPIMMSSRETVQNELASWFGGRFDRVRVVGTYNLPYNAAMMVREGMGAALCIRLDCHYPDLRFVALTPPLALGSALVWKKSQVHTPVVSALIDFLRTFVAGENGIV